MGLDSEKAVFLAALDLDTLEQRQAFVASACAADPALRAAVEELLLAHERPGNVLDAPAVCLDERPGAVVGPYRLLEQIGEGGFGLVFVAEQLRPVRRRVALKLIKPGMDTREVIARFEAERQALAMMDHPNIARVFDAGATASGRPYFVMELVRGVPVTEFADQGQLTLAQRLELFIDVCLAVQHAHQKGIIHRDLKPSNVLVTLHDGVPVVKVIDFGIAKAVGQQLAGRTVYTRFAQMIGTPLYMSPEQAEMSGLDVDTRSDIYSLGVLLYELLTGTTPLDRVRIDSAAPEEVRRILREEDPPRPSDRLTTLGEALGTVSERRGAAPGRLTAMLRGDLDWVVMKALEKDRARRYDTAAAFAADVRRFLNEEPVEARPPSALYRFSKFASRNRVALLTGALVAAALVLGTAVSIWQAVRATAARAEADASRLRADAARREAEEFVVRLKAANVLLDSARAHADQERWAEAHADYNEAARLQPDHYLVYSGRGQLYVKLGLWGRAARDYARAMELGASANNPGWWGVPQLFLYAGDHKNYRAACRQLLRHHEKATDPFVKAVVVRCCSISPRPPADAAELARKAEGLMQGWPGLPRFFGDGKPPWAGGFDKGKGRMPPPMPWAPRGPGQYLVGLARYRAGDNAKALESLNECVREKMGPPTQPLGYAVLALAYHKGGQPEEARAALAKAEAGASQWADAMKRGRVGSMSVPWFDWLECQCLIREARLLITGAPPPEDARLREVKLRALAAIKEQ